MSSHLFSRIRHWYRRFRISHSPQVNLVWGFFLYLFIGVVLLCIPLFHTAPVSFIDNIFTATSAISTTGLVTVSIADSYNLAGEIIVMLLIQIGGIGYMTLTTYYLLFTTKRITRWHQGVIGAEFTMPNHIKLDHFIKNVIVFTIIMELLGAACFLYIFREAGLDWGQATWYGIFHSVSAFCTAGFGLYNDSFVGYRNSGFANIVISILAIAGSLGFIVVTDIWMFITRKQKAISFTSKIILAGFLILLTVGTLIIYLSEPEMHQDSAMPLLTSFFQAMTAMTTVGFNTVDTGGLSMPILLFVIFLMYVGASPSGTAGGMKITTLFAMLAVLKSRLLGQKKIKFLNRKIPFERLYVATSTFILYTSLIFLFTFLMSFVESVPLDKILFEVASALGTVGLSMGITGGLSLLGKILIIVLMFIGRVGVLTFGFALLKRKDDEDTPLIDSDLAV